MSILWAPDKFLFFLSFAGCIWHDLFLNLNEEWFHILNCTLTSVYFLLKISDFHHLFLVFWTKSANHLCQTNLCTSVLSIINVYLRIYFYHVRYDLVDLFRLCLSTYLVLNLKCTLHHRNKVCSFDSDPIFIWLWSAM